MSEIILEMENITKHFPGVLALDNVNFSVKEGEIHALVGENGAGKSTLMRILSGVLPHGSYTGQIKFENKKYDIKSIKQSEEKGIAIIHQEFALSPYLSIAENIFLGNENSKAGIVNWEMTQNKAVELTKRVGLVEDVSVLIKDIGVGKRQLVEIAKALSKNVKLLILDEPTAALNEDDSENLLKLLLALKEKGLTSILISHKLGEVIEVADTVTILRDGQTIETIAKGDITEARIIKGMVGRELTDRFPKREHTIGDILFNVEDWNAYHPTHHDKKITDDVNINVRAGEVVGIAGLMGAGRTEFAMSVFGKSYGVNISGKAYMNGKQIDTGTVGKSIKNGLAYISEDRKGLGLILRSSVKDNITLPNLEKVSKAMVINENEEVIVADKAVEAFRIKCPTIEQETNDLSGGNQQKVVLAKWLFCESEVYIMDEPTRGIDVGAKHEVYTVVNNLAAEGKAIIFISSELPEILGVCDRIYVMSEGKIVGEMLSEEADQEKIMRLLV
ncbi:MAG: sugar ABC transporter ATP-binding protein [Clostridia bacterium]|nr:sugar ABC transporter ATP-binding protein [Clostridia bacterium]